MPIGVKPEKYDETCDVSLALALWVIQKNLPREIKRELRELLLQMHTDPAGIRILTSGAIARFVAIEETDYDTIRGMARQAEQVVSWPE